MRDEVLAYFSIFGVILFDVAIGALLFFWSRIIGKALPIDKDTLRAALVAILAALPAVPLLFAGLHIPVFAGPIPVLTLLAIALNVLVLRATYVATLRIAKHLPDRNQR